MPIASPVDSRSGSHDEILMTDFGPSGAGSPLHFPRSPCEDGPSHRIQFQGLHSRDPESLLPKKHCPLLLSHSSVAKESTVPFSTPARKHCPHPDACKRLPAKKALSPFRFLLESTVPSSMPPLDQGRFRLDGRLSEDAGIAPLKAGSERKHCPLFDSSWKALSPARCLHWIRGVSDSTVG